jgi:DNA-binding transcriptional LysR family regulator
MPRSSQLSTELMQTFLTLLEHGGDAMAAAVELGINQPSMSKRLAVLRHTGRGITRPWLKREGKRWTATAEGLRVLPAVRDILARYDRLNAFTEEVGAGLRAFTFGCGQQAATGFVLRAARRFHREQPDVPFRISQMRGRARIEGVANGSLDLAAVTDREEAIAATARGELYIDTLPEEPLVLEAAGARPGGGPMPAWHAVFTKLPPRGVSAEALPSFPLIVPEPDADIRRVLDAAAQQAGVLNELNITLEMGGWQAILAYVREGLGVGVMTQPAFEQDDAASVRELLMEKSLVQLHLQPSGPGRETVERSESLPAPLRGGKMSCPRRFRGSAAILNSRAGVARHAPGSGNRPCPSLSRISRPEPLWSRSQFGLELRGRSRQAQAARREKASDSPLWEEHQVWS